MSLKKENAKSDSASELRILKIQHNYRSIHELMFFSNSSSGRTVSKPQDDYQHANSSEEILQREPGVIKLTSQGRNVGHHYGTQASLTLYVTTFFFMLP